MTKSIDLKDATVGGIRTEQLDTHANDHFDFVSGEPEVQTVAMLLPAVQSVRERRSGEETTSDDRTTDWQNDELVADMPVMEEWYL